MIVTNKKVLLGSGSPRRRLLLKELGIDFRVMLSKTAEIPPPILKRDDIVKFLAEEKADVLKKELHSNEILITADTIVWLEDSMLGKPSNADDAFNMLLKLRGRNHQVYTAVCLDDGTKRKTFSVESNVHFKKVSDDDLREYIDLYKPFDKAGAYGAQECLQDGINPCSEKENKFLVKNHLYHLLNNSITTENKKRIPIIDRIEGCYFNVKGLPLVELVEELKGF